MPSGGKVSLRSNGEEMARPLSARDILLFIIAAIIPVIIHIGWAALMEFFVAPRLCPPGTPRLSYGIQWGLPLFVVVIPLGAISGLWLFLARLDFCLLGAAIASVAAALAILFLALMWNDDVPRNGYEISTWIVYPPPAICAAVILCWSSVGATLRIRSWSAAKNPGS